LKKTGHDEEKQHYWLKVKSTMGIDLKPKKSCFDERGNPAEYGFENQDCLHFPTYVMFDVTNQCNALCIHCPHSAPGYRTKHKTAHIEMQDFKRAIDECSEHTIDFLRMTADGEPFLHPEIIEMLLYATKRLDCKTGITTNGSLLDAEKAKKILESDLFMIDISLDAVNRETYEKIRKGLNFQKVTDNIESLLLLKHKDSYPLKVMVSFVTQENNYPELEQFKHYWQNRADEVLIREMTSNVNMIELPEAANRSAVERWPCPHLFRRIVINYDGMIKTCPIDWENKTVYKHITETTIYNAWHSEFYKKIRRDHLQSRFNEGFLCDGCKDWMHTPWHMGYEKVIKKMG
jgi:sulfatase maturation enzyme AslB (radical SAM superfamily)